MVASLEKLQQKLAEYNALLQERSREHNIEMDFKARLMETCNLQKKKLDDFKLGGVDLNESSVSVSSLQKQLNDYKVFFFKKLINFFFQRLLKCSSCNTNFKSHTLLRCMHTFWYLFIYFFNIKIARNALMNV